MSTFDPIDLSDFGRRTGLDVRPLAEMSGAERLVSPRDLVTADHVFSMPLKHLEGLMRAVPLVGDPGRKPYAGCRIERYRMDPRMSKIGQTFVERGKIAALHESFADKFRDHDVPFGIAKRGALIVFGTTASGEKAVAQYLPPIVEHIDGRHAVLDGIHRFSYVRAAGTTLEVIKVSEPREPFPCGLRLWADVVHVDAKPPKEKRFFDLRPELFRDLKHVGIDG